MKWTGRYEQYDAAAFRKDLISGLIVGIIAIPLGMAFAIASGVKPEYGIYTTIIAGILISLLGGSKFQIGGPTGAFIPILFAIVLQYGYENLLIAGFLAGIILVLMGVFKLGVLIKFIPRPVTTGFTAGIAVIIFSGQIVNFLGLTGTKKHENFLPNMNEILSHLASLNGYSVLTAAICLAAILISPRFLPKIPGSLVGLVLSSVIAALFFKGHVTTIGSSFGVIPSTLPHFHFPTITWDRVGTLIQPALAIALLGGIESLLSAVVADGMTGTRHNSNRELIGQGIANMVTPLFGGIPATGAIARTATNIKNGAVSPFSGIIHGIVVFLVLILFAPYASDIPLASMAPILMMVAWNMSERKEFAHILQSRTSDSLVLLITFLLTVLTNLTTAVEVGLVLSILLFVKRISEQLKVVKVLPDSAHKSNKVKAYMVSEHHDCPQFNIFTLEGPLFFGTASKFERSVMDMTPQKPNILLLRMSKVPYMDTTGEARLVQLIKEMEKSGGVVLISGIQRQPMDIAKSTGLYSLIREDRFFAHTGEAINHALTLMSPAKCRGCTHAAFRECESKSNFAANEKVSL
ncbi:SulP family inorganic anion transporter [Paenibacillus aurantiacus]|uniref:SulP family inorganic anion transporter n=1 Tax=Paenibacillus aurantiacus TaxID=1936118 RepID=A0ABV5KHQ8_9BACL